MMNSANVKNKILKVQNLSTRLIREKDYFSASLLLEGLKNKMPVDGFLIRVIACQYIRAGKRIEGVSLLGSLVNQRDLGAKRLLRFVLGKRNQDKELENEFDPLQMEQKETTKIKFIFDPTVFIDSSKLGPLLKRLRTELSITPRGFVELCEGKISAQTINRIESGKYGIRTQTKQILSGAIVKLLEDPSSQKSELLQQIGKMYVIEKKLQ